MTENNFDLIYEDWKASLKTRDRSAGSVSSNFEDLFEKLRSAGATFAEAHPMLPKATKAHQPPPALAKATYRNLRSNPKIAIYSEKEFIDQWNQDIADKATNAFFSVFPVPKNKDQEDDEPKVYGNMSVKEYKAQRRYSDQFPVLNTEELEKKMLSGSYNPLDDIEDILGKNKDKNGADS